MMDPDLISQADHIPVLLEPILENISPVGGIWIDATFGAGGSSTLIIAGKDASNGNQTYKIEVVGGILKATEQ